jgi:hypothetical protein
MWLRVVFFSSSFVFRTITISYRDNYLRLPVFCEIGLTSQHVRRNLIPSWRWNAVSTKTYKRRKVYDDNSTKTNVSPNLIPNSGPLRLPVGPVPCISCSPPWDILNKGRWNSEKCIETWTWRFYVEQWHCKRETQRLSLKMLLHFNVQRSQGLHVYCTRGASSLHHNIPHNTCPATKWLPGAYWFAVLCKRREIHAVQFEVTLNYNTSEISHK